MPHVSRVLFVVLLVIITFLPLHSAGTSDVAIWLDWITAIERDGFFSGYIAIYPPATWALLQGVALAQHALHVEMFLALKGSLALFLLLTSTVFFLWTRNLLLTAILHLGLLLNSVALGYLDIWYAPTVLLALWALKERKVFLFTVLYTISFLVKWQPLIVAPFLLVYIAGQADLVQWKSTLKVLLRDVALPAGVLIGAIGLPFGQGMRASLQEAMSHTILSGYALNYNWLLTWFLRLTQPDRFGPLGGGLVDYVDAPDWSTTGVSKVLFGLFYLAALAVFIRRPKTFEDLVRFALVGYLSYFTFNTGVHENHLFFAGLLAAVLCWAAPRDRYAALIVLLMANVNLFLFYGPSGVYPYQRVMGVDVSLPIALFNVVFFLAFWATACWREARPLAAEAGGQPAG